MTETTSTAPTGEQFPLPTSQDETAELQRLQALVVDHRAQNHEIVVVMGLGFVGAVMAGVIADSVRKGQISNLSPTLSPASSSLACSAHPPDPTGRSRF